MKKLFTLIFSLYLCGSIALGYEVPTHQAISQQAVQKSVLVADGKILKALGLKQLYPGKPDERIGKNELFSNSERNRHDIIALVRDGAGFEDDFKGSRFLHHFYDPQHDVPLTDISGAGMAFLSFIFGPPYLPLQKSPDWALEDLQEYLVGGLNGQLYSWRDARRYFRSALTLSLKEERDQHLGLTFQTLGHVMHHIQDMAQPQHVRNEQHPPIIDDGGLYEHFTNGEDILPNLSFDGYAPVFSRSGDHTTLASPRSFWTTGDGKGLAEFTSTNFISYRHNFVGSLEQINPHPDSPKPTGAGATIQAVNIGITPDPVYESTPMDGFIYFIGTPVTDTYAPAQSTMNGRSSTFSSYDVDLQHYDLEAYYCDDIPSHICHRTKAVFSVNRYTMLAAHDFLIPRAVGYSAGLINYFFRGEIDLVPDTNSANPGGYLLKNLGDDEMSGTFILYYDDVNDNRHTWQTWSPPGTLAAKTGQVVVPAFAPPGAGDPAPKFPGQYILLFDGQQGQELGAVIGKVVVTADAAGNISTAGGDALGFSAPGSGGAVTIETGATLNLASLATTPLIVAAGQTVVLSAGGEQHYTEIAVAGTLCVTADTILVADGAVGVTGAIEGRSIGGSDGINLTIHSGGPIAVTGRIETFGLNGKDTGSGDLRGGNGGHVTLRTAFPGIFAVPTIITRGGDAALTDARVPAKTFTGGVGGAIDITTNGVAGELALRFVGTEFPTLIMDTMPPQQGAHTLPLTTTFRRGLLTTGGYGGQFKGPDNQLGVTVAGTAGGAGGNISMTCTQPSTMQFDKTDLFTGGNIDVLLTYTRQAVFSPGTRPRLTSFFQRTGAMGGQGSSGQTHTHGGTGGSGGAAGAITINTCQLVTPPASFTSPPRVAPLILGGNVVTGLVTAPRPRIIDALDASGTRLYSIQAFGGGGGLPGGSGLSLAQCSKTGARCFTDDIPACPLAPDFSTQICLPVPGGTGSPGNWGGRGADGLVSCGPLLIPSALVGTGLVCQ